MADNKSQETGFVPAVGDAIKSSDRPGKTKAEAEVGTTIFDHLGDLEDFPDPIDLKNEEGAGPHFVVLSDVLSGAGGESYKKGEVHRISKLVVGWDDKDKDVPRMNYKRLLGLNAIRQATREEVEQGFAEVTVASESPEVIKERNLRIEAERKLAQYEAAAKTDTVGDPFANG